MATVAENAKRLDGHDQRLASLENNQSSLNEKFIRMDEKMNSMAKEQKNTYDVVTEIKTDVKEMRLSPGKKWDSLLFEIIKYVALFGIGYLLAK